MVVDTLLQEAADDADLDLAYVVHCILGTLLYHSCQAAVHSGAENIHIHRNIYILILLALTRHIHAREELEYMYNRQSRHIFKSHSNYSH